MKLPQVILYVVLAANAWVLAPGVVAQCDSTPPQLQPAFTLYGAKRGDTYGQWMYVIHDTLNHPQLVISSSGTEYAMRVYSRFAGESDTTYKCCLRYTEAHECHVTGSPYRDYIVKQSQVGSNDSIFLIPGSPEGIWSKRRQLLMTPASYAQIAVGNFDGTGRDGIAIGDWSANGGGKPRLPGNLSIWHGRDSLSVVSDTLIWGDGVDWETMDLGLAVGAADLNGDGIPDLCVQSGAAYDSLVSEMNIFWGGPGFPRNRTRWRDRHAQSGWFFERGSIGFADVVGDSTTDLLIMTFMKHDTVWGSVKSADRIFCYRGGKSFDTIPAMIWRPQDVPDQVCTPYLSGFGSSIVNVGDINGSHQNAIAIGASQSFGGDGAIVIYLDGKNFDTLPDAYFGGITRSFAGNVVGGIDFNNDGIMDLAIPLPNDDGAGGTDQPTGEVAFIAGSKKIRSIGVHSVFVDEPLLPDQPQVTAYPNPAREVIWVEEPQAPNPVGAEIVDPLGKARRKFALHPGRNILSLKGLPSGTYRLIEHLGNTIVSKTIIHVQ